MHTICWNWRRQTIQHTHKNFQIELVKFFSLHRRQEKELIIVIISVVNSDSNFTPINSDVWSEREVVTNMKVDSSNNNNNKPRSNLGTKCKEQNCKQKIKREEKQTHQEMFT
jgi:hypothetical protein